VPSLGIVCVDEEHDASYKQESDPRYDARTVAAKRASLEGAVAIFGSATPRPESWEKLERLQLGGRIAAPMPSVRVVDLRREAGYPLSAPLLAELGGIAERGGKAILLLNRRGVAPAVHCRACGVTRRCVNCDVALTLHGDRSLRCHHCGAVEILGETCPACGSAELARIGAGTQKLERELAKHVPELERIRLDADAVAKPEQLRDALERFSRADRAVLVGTQMVAKGHHFPGVELAAVVDADTGLGLPDFRAEERTFQLITQLAGRSGRDAPGRVIVQTFQPDARAIAYAARHDVAGFNAGELERRRALGYPPFRHLVRIAVSGPDQADALRALEELKRELGDAELLGPAPLLRLRNRHRAQLVGKTSSPRALATRAAALLSSASAGDAPRRPHGRRRRRPAEPVAVTGPAKSRTWFEPGLSKQSPFEPGPSLWPRRSSHRSRTRSEPGLRRWLPHEQPTRVSKGQELGPGPNQVPACNGAGRVIRPRGRITRRARPGGPGGTVRGSTRRRAARARTGDR